MGARGGAGGDSGKGGAGTAKGGAGTGKGGGGSARGGGGTAKGGGGSAKGKGTSGGGKGPRKSTGPGTYNPSPSPGPSPSRVYDFAAKAAKAAAATAAGEDARAEAAARLGALLRRTTIRTLKSEIRLPPLVRHVESLPFTRAHAVAYNELVAFLRRSLLLADWADENHTESLLNSRQVRRGSAFSLSATPSTPFLCVIARVPGNYLFHDTP